MRPFFQISLILLLMMTQACMSAGGESSSSGSSTTTSSGSEESGEALNLGNESIESYSFDSDSVVTMNVEDIDPSKDYLLMVYSSDFESSSTYAYQLGESLDSDLSAAILQDSSDVSEDIHEQLRDLESDLDGQVKQAPRSISALQAATSPSLGSTRSFNVLNSLSGSTYDTVVAELRYANDDFLVYVDQRNEDALTDEELEDLLDSFASVVDDERNLFGEESDVDGDGRFAILMSQAVNELGSSGGGMLTGFFYAVDLYPSESFPISNEMEIYYSMVPDPEGEFGTAVSKSFTLSNILSSVLPHEFQHMINYNQHVLINGGASENSYLNEGLSHLAEDIYSLNGSGFMAETGIENPSRVAYFLNSHDSVCFTCGSNLTQRGGSYLFVRYLYEQAELGNLQGAASGAAFIQNLLDSDSTGVENLVQASLGSDDTGGFAQLMGLFTLATYFSNTNMLDDDRYAFTGINLRSTQNDNRSTVLDGPSVDTLSSWSDTGTLVSSGMVYLSLSGADLEGEAGQIQLEVSGSMQGGAFLVEME